MGGADLGAEEEAGGAVHRSAGGDVPGAQRSAAASPRTHPAPEAAEEEPEAKPETDTQAYLADPYGAIARLTGEPDHETWWEKHFEHTTSEDAYRQAIFEFGAGLRSVDYEGPRRREETLLREAFMRRAIRDTLGEGHDPDRVVVVCGAYHAPVLTAEEHALTDAEKQALPRAPTVLTLMPYSYYRLSAQSGYGAGNAAPGYFQALWEELRRVGEGAPGTPSTARLAPRYLAEVAGRLRKAGTIRSSAEVIEAVRLAVAMAAVRGDAPAPTLRDLRDAAVTCLGQGDPASIRRWLDDVAVGDALGKVPPGVLRTAIQDDFYRSLEDLRLSDYLKDKEQIIKGATSKEWLDLREDRFTKSPDAAFRDRRRSVFLHRLDLLGIGFAKNTTSEDDRAQSTYKEVWKARWTPECEIALVENALRGDSVEIAAVRQFQERIDAVTSVREAAELTRRAVECDLPDAMLAALGRVQSLAVDDGDFTGIAAAAIELGHLTRYRDVRRFDVAPLRPLVAQLFLRGSLMAPEAARCSEDAASGVGKGLANLQSVVLLGDEETADIDPERWSRALDAIADDELSSSHVAGVACALLLERGQLPDAVLDRRVAKRLSPGADPGEGAGFFEGLATRNRYALLSKKSLWSAMSAFIEASTTTPSAAPWWRCGAPRRLRGERGQENRRILAEVWGGGGEPCSRPSRPRWTRPSSPRCKAISRGSRIWICGWQPPRPPQPRLLRRAAAPAPPAPAQLQSLPALAAHPRQARRGSDVRPALRRRARRAGRGHAVARDGRDGRRARRHLRPRGDPARGARQARRRARREQAQGVDLAGRRPQVLRERRGRRHPAGRHREEGAEAAPLRARDPGPGDAERSSWSGP